MMCLWNHLGWIYDDPLILIPHKLFDTYFPIHGVIIIYTPSKNKTTIHMRCAHNVTYFSDTYIACYVQPYWVVYLLPIWPEVSFIHVHDPIWNWSAWITFNFYAELRRMLIFYLTRNMLHGFRMPDVRPRWWSSYQVVCVVYICVQHSFHGCCDDPSIYQGSSVCVCVCVGSCSWTSAMRVFCTVCVYPRLIFWIYCLLLVYIQCSRTHSTAWVDDLFWFQCPWNVVWL